MRYTTNFCKTFVNKSKIFKSPYLGNYWTKLDLATCVLQVIDRPLHPHKRSIIKTALAGTAGDSYRGERSEIQWRIKEKSKKVVKKGAKKSVTGQNAWRQNRRGWNPRKTKFPRTKSPKDKIPEDKIPVFNHFNDY